MAFQIPKRKTPARVSLAGALDYVLRGSVIPNFENEDIGYLLHQVHIRLMQFAMTPPHMRDAIMQPLSQFALDPVHVVAAIVDGIVSGVLSVEGLPPEHLDTWRARPVGVDWQTGVVIFSRDPRAFTPTLALGEVDALFRETAPASSEAVVLDDVTKSETGGTPKLRNPTGPRPAETERLKQAMREMDPERLKEATLFELMNRFKGKQTSTRSAKAAVLSESAEQKPRTTPNNEK